MTPHAHRRYVPPREPEPPREPLALVLLGGAGLVIFAIVWLLLLAAS